MENAAKVINRKNAVPHQRPIEPIPLNMLLIVTNRRPGPAAPAMSSDERPFAKQAGKMMRPAQSATRVSSVMMFTDSPSRVRFLSI